MLGIARTGHAEAYSWHPPASWQRGQLQGLLGVANK